MWGVLKGKERGEVERGREWETESGVKTVFRYQTQEREKRMGNEREEEELERRERRKNWKGERGRKNWKGERGRKEEREKGET